jgi:Tfp pilus assembly protein PilF
LEHAIELRPRDASGLADLGNIYLHQHRLQDAVRVLERALALDASLPRAHNTMGLVAIERGDEAAGERSFRAAIAAQPDLAEALSNLANLLAGRKEYGEAAFYFAKSLQSNPSGAGVRHSYGVVLALLHQDARAVQELQRAIDLEPGNEQARLDLADVLASSGRVQEAIQEYEVVMRSADPTLRTAAAFGLRSIAR